MKISKAFFLLFFLFIICEVASYNNKEQVVRRDIVIIPSDALEEDSTRKPTLIIPVSNTTVIVGHNALLVCIVENPRNNKVSWIRPSTDTILTEHQSVHVNDSRISLSYNDHRSWYLNIRNVKETDRGWYTCQVNSNPIISYSVYLQVLVPPSIIQERTSVDTIVRELSSVNLRCEATGYPEPYVIWRREDGNDFNYNGIRVNVVDGEIFYISKVSRLHMGTYYCIAQNGIPPPVNHKISLIVHFPPILNIPNQLVGGHLGQEVQLVCISEAFPKSLNYWLKANKEMLVAEQHSGYYVEFENNAYITRMSLTIKNLTLDDFGTYSCTSINPLGTTDGVIKLYEVEESLNLKTQYISSTEPIRTKEVNNDENKSVSKSSLIHISHFNNYILLLLVLIVIMMTLP